MAKLDKGFELTFMGHSTFKIKTPGGKNMIIDPWLMNNPACPEGTRYNGRDARTL
jgi:L-ascorbate metabolism protein UlaG (beta-lactamase superfamily)